MITTINVTFTANTEGTPGTWEFSPDVTIRADHPSIVQYQLDPGSTEGWSFERIAIGENSPGETDFIEVSLASNQEMELAGIVVNAEFPDPRSIRISLDGIPEQRIEIGVLLTVSNGIERHTCRDPQIVLERDPLVVS
jgi:hypothetical protein